MPNEPTVDPELNAAPDLEVSPVVVVSRTFAARPSSLPDAQQFLTSSLAESAVEPEYLRALHTAILDAMLLAAGSQSAVFEVVIHLYPEDAEVEVLAPDDRTMTEVLPVANESFAVWLHDALRQQGLSQEAAARQLGVSVRTVSRWVGGQTEPRLRDMRRIHEVFGRGPIS
jgi:DNA-binding transcriptional regulator YiaG